MISVKINHANFDALPALSREIVMMQTSGETLATWYDALIEKAAELSEFCKAFDAAGYDAEAIAGKLAFCKIAARWCEHRLINIGHPVPYPPSDPRKKELHRQQKRIDTLRAQVRSLGGDPDETRAVAA